MLERIVAERKLTLLFTEHDMMWSSRSRKRSRVLHQGSLIAEGSPAEVRNDAEVRRSISGGQ